MGLLAHPGPTSGCELTSHPTTTPHPCPSNHSNPITHVVPRGGHPRLPPPSPPPARPASARRSRVRGLPRKQRDGAVAAHKKNLAAKRERRGARKAREGGKWEAERGHQPLRELARVPQAAVQPPPGLPLGEAKGQ